MASGEVRTRPGTAIVPGDGAVVTSSGRISAVRKLGGEFVGPPFGTDERVAIDDALTEATEATGVQFSVYIGDAVNPAAETDAVFPSIPDAAHGVLLAVYPNQKAFEIRSGVAIADVVTDRVAQLGITAATATFARGDLIDGLVSAIRVMANAIVAP